MKFVILALALITARAQADITVYTDRPVVRFATAAKMFEAKTGQKVVFVEGAYADLLTRLQAEGKNTPADLVVTKDIVYLAELKAKGLLKAMQNTKATTSVHSFMKDPQNFWVGLTFRARTAAYDPSRVSASELTTYEELASPRWKGRLCLRTSKAAYNEALTGHLMASYGEAKAKNILLGWLDNLAMPVMANDTLILEEIAKGNCDVGIVNHYYLALLIAKRPSFPVRIAFLDQQRGGVHTNGTGVGLIAHSNKGSVAREFVDILLSDAIQIEMTNAHYDYPTVKGLLPETLIKDWGTFGMAATPWSRVGNLAPKARVLMDQVGYK